MNHIILKARAKINLTLDVLGKRDDGYHDIEMIMQTVNLYDTVSIKKTYKDEIKLETNLKWLPSDDRNLAYKAAEIIKKNYGIKTGVFIELRKRIPVAAGLAGGSSDAAAVLVGMKILFELDITTTELMAMGKELGADVPYCIMRKTALAQGIGDKLTRLPSCPECYVVIAKPNVSISTAYIYKIIDNESIEVRPNTELMIQAIKDNDLVAIAKNMYNVMEKVTSKENPVIGELKQFLIEKGALGAVMSGSGPTVFGLFDDEAKAKDAYYRLKIYSQAKDVFLTTIY